MLSFVGAFLSPIVSFFIFFTGSSLLFTVLALVLRERGTSLYWIAGLTSCFYGGYVLSAIHIERFIVRVGIIRAHATFASLTTVATLLHVFFQTPASWLILRFLYGVGMAGLCLTIQNWLLNKYEGNGVRGRILAIYMITMYASQSFGQYILKYFDMGALTPFCGAAFCTVLCILPVTMTKIAAPSFEKHTIFGLRTVFSISPSGATGALVSGIILGNIYGIIPIVLKEWNYSLAQISTIMSVIIIGGMILQYPIGKISDCFERRTVFVIVCSIALLLTLVSLITHQAQDYRWFILTKFIWGGVVFTLYPISMNLACDRVRPCDLLATTGGLMVSYSIGASVGPFMAAFCIKIMGAVGLYVLFVTTLIFLIGFVLWRMHKREPVSVSAQKVYTTIPVPSGISLILARVISKLKNKP